MQTLPFFYINVDSQCIQPYISSNKFNCSAVAIKRENTAEGVETTVYLVNDGKLEVTITRETCENSCAIRQKTKVKNVGDEDTVVDTLSSLYVNSIGSDGEKRWYEDRFSVYRCDFTWQGEGQWRVKRGSEEGRKRVFMRPTTTIITLFYA